MKFTYLHLMFILRKTAIITSFQLLEFVFLLQKPHWNAAGYEECVKGSYGYEQV